MREESVARRYAAALFEKAAETGNVSAVDGDLKKATDLVTSKPELSAFLADPIVTSQHKKQLLTNVFGGAISPLVAAFLQMLVDKRRIILIDLIAQEFARLVLEHKGIAHATATTAVPLSAEETAALVRSLEARSGKTIELETAVDPDVIGGVFVRIGDTVLDGTVRGSLSRLREQLMPRR